MDEIIITDLSSRVLDAMRARDLKAKSIREFERYGLRRIVSHFSEHGWTSYSKEAVWAFVLQGRLETESGQLPTYQWAHTRRAAVYAGPPRPPEGAMWGEVQRTAGSRDGCG